MALLATSALALLVFGLLVAMANRRYVANTPSAQASHDQLVSFMWRAGGVVLLIGLGVAVLLARGRWWLVDRALARHEQFLHDTAHELRSPIYKLREIIHAGLSGAEPAERVLERARRVVDRTDQLICDLLDLSRIETGRNVLETRHVRLDELVCALIEERADEPPVLLQTSPTMVIADSGLLRSAVNTLLDNAYLHGRDDAGLAEVTVTVAQGAVTVSDRGPGVVEPQLLPHQIRRTKGARPGRRSSDADLHATPLGLGLAIAGWVARVHGGHLQAANRADGGAVFTIELREVNRTPPRGSSEAGEEGRLPTSPTRDRRAGSPGLAR